MTLLHDYFRLRDFEAFQSLLNGTVDRGLSTSAGKLYIKSSPITFGPDTCDVNARDTLGRTVLHLACASLDTLRYVKLLLRHPHINVNLADTESHWTPLHKALYNANLHTAILLLQRSDIDQAIKDLEGYTAFDLYNSTLDKTKPTGEVTHAELYMWGTNRNATLGFSDGNNRVYPEQVPLQNKDGGTEGDGPKLISRFLPIHVRQLQMSKLHTAVVTSENSGNIRLCGFGSGGRLGPGQHTQFSLRPLQNFPHSIVSVALGQDHTLALTKSGEVLSWGLNRFSQLGYVLEGPAAGEHFGRTEEPIQAAPRKVQGALKKELVKGVAASKGASACWTDTDVYTWGTNYGQLGYDRAAQAVQILPRKATKVTQPVVAISMNDFCMACLLITCDVICIWSDRAVKIVFPVHAFPSEIQPYRPPQAPQDAKISKITSSDDMFAALSLNGELFTFSVPNPLDVGVLLAKEKSGFKPQRVWALRKKFSSVKDVALGSDGSIIVCTESGHVFIRSHNVKSRQTSTLDKPFRFQRLPAFQRIAQVCSNSTGAFGALRVEYRMQGIEICGRSFSQDIAKIQPFLHVWWTRQTLGEEDNCRPFYSNAIDDDGPDDHLIQRDVEKLRYILDYLVEFNAVKGSNELLGRHGTNLPFGADVTIQMVPGYIFPVHCAVLGARSQILDAILSGSIHQKKIQSISVRRLDQQSSMQGAVRSRRHVHLKVSGCQPISLVILLTFLYTDDVLSPWDHRISAALGQPPEWLEVNFAQVRADLQALANLLELSDLSATLDSPVKPSPVPTLSNDMQRLYNLWVHGSHGPSVSAVMPDVVLQLSDKNVHCYSAILRARSEFFADFFDEEEWTRKRWNAEGVLMIDMKHLEWRVMDYVLRFVCYGSEGMFQSLDFVDNTDEILDFMFDVMAAANELLLDRLVLLCSSIILKYINVYNALSVLSEATCLHAQQLIDRVQSFIAVNMELFLETAMLDDTPAALVAQLAEFVRDKQIEKNPVSRSNRLADEALTKHADWLASEDISASLMQSDQSVARKDSSTFRIVPTGSKKSPQPSPIMQPIRTMRRLPSSDDIFAMDDPELRPSYSVDSSQASLSVAKLISATSPGGAPVWKASSAPRVDMKTVMAEAASSTTTSRKPQEGLRGPSSHQPTDKLQHPINSMTSAKAGHTSTIPVRWKVSAEQAPIRSSPPVPLLKEGVASGSSPQNLSSVSRRPLGPTPVAQELGPIITPMRQASNSSTVSRRTMGKAWTQPLLQTPPSLKQPEKVLSFLAIQQSQSEISPAKDRRSLLEIQEEERALQAEADFLVWWTAEEERVKMEMEIAQAQEGAGKKPGHASKGRGGKTKVDQGQGRVKTHRQPLPQGAQNQSPMTRQAGVGSKPRSMLRKPLPEASATP